MITIPEMTPAELEKARVRIAAICEELKDREGPEKHEELGRRLYAALGEVHIDDWPEIFGRGGTDGPCQLATAYSAARLNHARRANAITSPNRKTHGWAE